MSRAVLVPFDGSPLAERALRHALETLPDDARITVLDVIDLFEPDPGPPAGESDYEPLMGSEAWYRRAEEASDRRLAEARAIAEDAGQSIETVTEIGDPERVVVDYAEEEPVDYIVMGAHGRPDAERPVFGSVAETVARRARVPVTIVR